MNLKFVNEGKSSSAYERDMGNGLLNSNKETVNGIHMSIDDQTV